jgi:NADH-quinone oxidoreductase subunit M
MDLNILSLLIWLPIIGMLAIAFVPREKVDIIKIIAATATGLQLFLAILLWMQFDKTAGGFQFMERYDWIPSFNIFYTLGVDGLSLPMVVLTPLLSFLAVFVSWNTKRAVKGFFALFLLLDTGMMGVFLALDFFLFYVFWEVMLLFGSVLMLIAILALYFTCGQTFDMITLMHTAPTALNGVLWWGMSAIKVIWILLFVGFAIKVPVFPFHTWLPLAHVEAPTAISVILAGVLLKMGIYGMLRVNYGMLPEAVWWFAGALAVLGVINVIWGGLAALAQKDLKKMVAYSSINHLGYALMGMAAIVAVGAENGNNYAAAEAGMSGAVFQMFNHGTISAMLFIIAGVIYDRAHHREIAGFGGLAKQMPIFAGVAAVAFFAGLGLPALSGFISEFMCFVGAFPVFRTIVIIGTFGILINAAYFLRAFTLIPLAIITFILGVYPAPFLNVIRETISGIIEHVATLGIAPGIF